MTNTLEQSQCPRNLETSQTKPWGKDLPPGWGLGLRDGGVWNAQVLACGPVREARRQAKGLEPGYCCPKADSANAEALLPWTKSRGYCEGKNLPGCPRPCPGDANVCPVPQGSS